MHYVDSGSGRPILLLHGNPSSAFSWRKVIPRLTQFGRVLAVDHMGFGKSAKPEIEYSFFQHATFLEEFIRIAGLKDIILVIQDWGSALGFDYAARHLHNVRGIMFFESIIRPYSSWNVFPSSDPNDTSRELFKKMKQGDRGGPGWQLNVDQNVFITQLLPHLLDTKLPQSEMAEYEAPFAKPEWRIPIWRLPKDDPIDGDPADVAVTVARYSLTVGNSKMPKLLIWSPRGATLIQEHVDWLQKNFQNLSVVQLKSGVHFFQESNADEFLAAFGQWFQRSFEA
jgi:haloalkane dehalogenase